MATPTTDLNAIGDLNYILGGDLLGASPTNVSMAGWCKTVNGSAPYSTANLKSITPALTRTPATLSWTSAEYGNKIITVTANCAWKVTITGSSNLQVNATTQQVILSGISPSGILGGNGTITIYRTTNPGTWTATVTITFSNGAGGSSTVTIPCSTM